MSADSRADSRAGGPPPRELWRAVAFVLFFVTAASFVYLGSRPGGRAPLVFYRFGRDVLFLAAFLTLVVGLFRSWRRPPLSEAGRMRAFLALGMVLAVTPFRLPYPSSRENRPSRVPFELPVEGTWRTYWGGDDKETNRLVGFLADRRYGIDLVREVEGTRVKPNLPGGAPRTPADYWSHGETVFAPAPGRVAWIRDGIADSPLLRWAGGPPAGNTLVLEVAADEYLFVTHLLAGSFEVAVGDEVALGAPLARIGYSGFSPMTPEPHLALHLQTTADEGWGEGIPFRFHGYLAAGERIAAGMPRGGVDAERGPIGDLVSRAGGVPGGTIGGPPERAPEEALAAPPPVMKDG